MTSSAATPPAPPTFAASPTSSPAPCGPRSAASATRSGRPPRPAAQPVAPEPQPARTIAELNEQLARIPECRYALIRKDGGITFLELRKIGVGRYLIVQLHGAPRQFRHQTLSLRLQALAALHIAEDMAGAAKRFSDLAGECAKCHSPLTDPESRRLGLGPTCRQYFGL